MNRLMVSVVAAGCALAGFAEGFVVAKDGAAACAVVAGEFAKPAAELTNYLHRITGATFEVVKRTEEAGERPVIVLEKGEAVRDKDKFVAWQSYALKSSAKRLRLVSPHPRGMLYAVYGLLRDHCGVGFYSPTFEVVPKNANLVLDVDDVQKPAFRWRGYGWWDFRPHWRPFIFKNRGMELVYVPAGVFIRGSDDPNAPRDERPRRKIKVSGFWIAKNLVTFAQLKRFAEATDRPKPTEDWPQTPLYDRTNPWTSCRRTSRGCRPTPMRSGRAGGFRPRPSG